MNGVLPWIKYEYTPALFAYQFAMQSFRLSHARVPGTGAHSAQNAIYE